MKRRRFKKRHIGVVFLFIEFCIILAFVRLWTGSQPIKISNTKEIDIIVENVFTIRVLNDRWLIVTADSTQFVFYGWSTRKEYSVSELSNAISKGDKLSLIYYEESGLFRNHRNVVVEARSGTETYRSIKEYNLGNEGLPTFVIILFTIIQLAYLGIVLLYRIIKKW